MDKFALEGKVKELEVKIKEQTKKINDLTEATNTSKQVNTIPKVTLHTGFVIRGYDYLWTQKLRIMRNNFYF
jgi:hypothetical protein